MRNDATLIKNIELSNDLGLKENLFLSDPRDVRLTLYNIKLAIVKEYIDNNTRVTDIRINSIGTFTLDWINIDVEDVPHEIELVRLSDIANTHFKVTSLNNISEVEIEMLGVGIVHDNFMDVPVVEMRNIKLDFWYTIECISNIKLVAQRMKITKLELLKPTRVFNINQATGCSLKTNLKVAFVDLVLEMSSLKSCLKPGKWL